MQSSQILSHSSDSVYKWKWLSLWEFAKIDTVMSADVFFKVPRICDKLMGIWPIDVIQSKLDYLHPVSLLLTLLLASFTQWTFVFMHMSSTDELLASIVPASSLSVTLFKTLLLVSKKKKLRYVLQILNSLWYNDGKVYVYNTVMVNEIELRNFLLIFSKCII